MVFDMDGYKAELDKINAAVLPATADCHGRLVIHERGFGPKKRGYVERVFGRLSEKYPEQDAEMLAEKAIEAVEKEMA